MDINNSKLTFTILTTILLSLSLMSCGGGGSSSLPDIPLEKNPCSSNQLQKSDTGCVDAKEVSVDNNPGPDGIDLTGNGIPELVYVTPFADPTTGIDFNGDGIVDYYLSIDDNGKKSLHTDRNATSDTVTILVDADQNPIGFDEGKTKNTSLADILANKLTPVININFKGRTYQNAPNVTLTCDSSIAPCNAIVYSINDTADPSFSGSGTIIMGGNISTTVLSLGRDNSGQSLNGTYILKFLTRSTSGQVSTLQTEVFIIDDQVCNNAPTPQIVVTSNATKSVDNGLTKNLLGNTTNTFTLDGSSSFSAQANGGISSYFWNQEIIGDGKRIVTIDNSINSARIFTVPDRITTLKFTLNVTDSLGCSATTNATISLFIMEDPIAAIFVNKNLGNDSTGNGSRTKPFATISHGLVIAAATQPQVSDLYITTSPVGSPYSEPNLIIPDGVSLYGAFNDSWIRDVNNTKTKLQFFQDVLKLQTLNLRGLDFQQITQSTELSGFTILTQFISTTVQTDSDLYSIHAKGIVGNNATLVIRNNDISTGDALAGISSGSGSSYGVYVNELLNVVLSDNKITAGRGGSGSYGSFGSNGTSGDVGNPGSNGACYNIFANTNTAKTAAGTGGQSVNPSSSGLTGGTGGNVYFLGGVGSAANAGENGTGLCAGTAGVATNGVVRGHASAVLERGIAGCPTVSIDAPIHNSTKANSINISQFRLGYFQSADGNDGTIGSNGIGGSGGGGGGGAANGNDAFGATGGGGGGGGAGGLSGEPGRQGYGGSSSIAIYLASSTATVSGNTINTKDGGPAGMAGIGGAGGTGGAGGAGGVGGTCSLNPDFLFSGIGTDGQKGTDGGTGGDASAGAGGPSIGIFIDSGMTPIIKNNIITTGNGGKGGDARHGAAGNGGVSYGIYAIDSASTISTISNNAFTLGNPGLGGIINPDTSTTPNTAGLGTAGSIGVAVTKN